MRTLCFFLRISSTTALEIVNGSFCLVVLIIERKLISLIISYKSSLSLRTPASYVNDSIRYLDVSLSIIMSSLLNPTVSSIDGRT